MGHSQPRQRWVASLVMAALLLLGTYGLRHACSDAHAGDGTGADCAVCRVVGSSTATLNTHSQFCTLLVPGGVPALPADLGASDAHIAEHRSRGPPSC